MAEVGGIIIGNPAVDGAREVSFRRYDNTVRSIKSNHSIYDALSYGITHMKGDKGWYIGLHKHIFDGNNQAWVETSKNLTVLDYYSYRSHQRDISWDENIPTSINIREDVLFYGGLLMHQYWIDQYVKIEENNLTFIKHNQGKLKSALYSGLADAVAAGEERDEGKYTILPSTYLGSPRNIHQKYQDAMARARR